ncbi:MAG: DUF3298 domain-containing protein, partial [Enhydrobacter sp.]|nr:DUF3298 domain-containing protein [Enhydrobacter sp.]
ALSAYLVSYERRGGVEFLTLKRESPAFRADADYFIYKMGGEYWDYVTAEIRSDLIGNYYEAHAFAAERFSEVRNGRFNLPMEMSWSRRVQEYFREGELVSLQIDAWQFFGGAHGTRGVYTRNYGGPTVGRINLRHLFNHEAVSVVHNHCVNQIAQMANDLVEARQVSAMLSNSVDGWKPFSQWLFNRNGIRFWFSMYSDLPYVAGVFDISIPWSLLKQHVNESCRDLPIGKFIDSC